MYKILGISFQKFFWILWPLRFIVRYFVYPDTLNKEIFAEKLATHKLVFVLPHMSFVDAFVLNLVLKKLGLPKIGGVLHSERAEHARSLLLAIRPLRFPLGFLSGSATFEKDVAAFLSSPQAKPLYVVPVSVFWGKIPEVKDRFFLWKILFPDDGRANGFQKLILVLFHCRDLHIYFGQPQDVYPPAAGQRENSAETAGREDVLSVAQMLRRSLLAEFKKERVAALGPTLYDFDTIAETILTEPETQALIESCKEPPQRVRDQIVEYLGEIAADYNRLTVRYAERVLDFVWTRIFTGIRVRGFERVRDVAKSAQVIWMPCHRSHLDYLLLSYLLNRKGLIVPHIAAGVNLNFWPIGSLLRRGGAFFLRRSFQGNRVYTHTFVRYVDFLMRNGFPLEFFQEGGRSRIGKLLPPKRGMLSFCIGSILRRAAENAYIIPIYFGYEKVVEDEAYARELQGNKKQKENVWQLIMALRKLFHSYGSVDVSFGKPIRVADEWARYFSRTPENLRLPLQLCDIPQNIDTRDARVQEFVKYLACRVNEEINKAATASGSSLLAAILLATPEPVVPRETLVQRLRVLNKIISILNAHLEWNLATSAGSDSQDDFVLSDTSATTLNKRPDPTVSELPLGSADIGMFVETVLKEGDQWGFILRKNENSFEFLVRNVQKELHLWWYRGTIFHILALVGVVAIPLLENKQDIFSMQELCKWFDHMRALWYEETFWPQDEESEKFIKAALAVFTYFEITEVTENGIKVVDHETKREWLQFFADLVRPERELYGLIVAAALYEQNVQKGNAWSRETVLQKVEFVHRSAFLRGETYTPAQLSRVFGKRVFETLQKNSIFTNVNGGYYQVVTEKVAPFENFFEIAVWQDFMES